MSLPSRWITAALIGLAFHQTALAQKNTTNLYVLPGLSTEKSKAQSPYVDQLENVNVDLAHFEFEPGYVYLRKKMNSGKYVLYKGMANPETFSKLYSFSGGTTSPAELLNYKFYRKTNKKAFEDELDLYFDASGVYYDASPSLYFKSKQWTALTKSNDALKIVGFETLPDKAELRNQRGELLGKTPMPSPVLSTGINYFFLDKEGYFPFVYGLDAENLDQKKLKLDLLAQRISSEDPSSFNLYSVSADSSHHYLDSAEIVLRNQLDLNYGKLASLDTLFQKDYYPALVPNESWSEAKNAKYKEYRKQFDRNRKLAFEVYAKNWINRISDQEANLQLIASAKTQKHNRNLNLDLTAQVLTWSKQNQGYQVKLAVSGASNWVSANWEGLVFVDSTKAKGLDSLAKKSIKFPIKVKAQDWPVSFVGLDGQRAYRYYRFQSPEWTWGKTPVRLAGQWTFSPAMMSLEDVARYVRSDSMQAIDQLNQKLEQELERQKLELKSAAEERQKLDFLYRGPVVEINGGEFLYKGKNVSLSPFAINATEISQEHYQRIMAKNPSKEYLNPKLPVLNISWEKADEFCQEIGGFLPTEAQWEYAARAGTSTYYYWGDRQMQGKGLSPEPWAVFADNSLELGKPGPAEVGTHRPNAWGLYDMAGNVQEWVHDAHAWWYGSTLMSKKDPKGPSTLVADDHRIKGGGWRSDKRDLEHAKYDHEDPRFWADDLGFRCAFTPMSGLSLDSLKLKLDQYQSKQKK